MFAFNIFCFVLGKKRPREKIKMIHARGASGLCTLLQKRRRHPLFTLKYRCNVAYVDYVYKR